MIPASFLAPNGAQDIWPADQGALYHAGCLGPATIQHDGSIELKQPKQIASDSLQNPSDPDAAYCGHKGQGYQVQVMETFIEHEADKDAQQLNLITYVQVVKACQSDTQALLPAIQEVLEKDLAPE